MAKDPDLAHFEHVALAVLAGFPEPFRRMARAVAVQVADWPTPAMLADLDIDDPLDLTGLYDGTPLTEASATFPAFAPDVVWLFREPILDEWRARGDVGLDDLIAHVTIHEFAHHFGWSDAEIARIAPRTD